jgi:hypothetical protein
MNTGAQSITGKVRSLSKFTKRPCNYNKLPHCPAIYTYIEVMKRLLPMLILLLSLFNCAQKSETPSPEVQNLKKLSEELNNKSKEVSSSTAATADSTLIRITQKNEEQKQVGSYAQIFCELLNQKNLSNPFELEKYLSTTARANRFLPLLQGLNGSAECKSTATVVNQFPLQVFEIETGLDVKVFFMISLDKDYKITNISLQYGSNLSIEKHHVEMRDGTKLFTIVMHELGQKRPFVITKTPYLNQSPLTYFYQYGQFNEMGYNSIIQANRGSFGSTGDFRWLHLENINDAEDTLNWVNKLETSNQRNLSYGVSYDGFNSLTFAATNHPSLIGSISCSSPASAVTDSLTGSEAPTFSYLDYINHRETSQKASLLYQKAAFILEKKPGVFEDMDKELFGRELKDWRDFVSSIKNNDNSYFEQRNLYPSLLKSSTPIFHVAGLVNDQDSRDTLLAFTHIQDSLDSIAQNKHYLYMHGGGHSCGDVLKSPGFASLEAGQTQDIPRAQQYSLSKASMVSMNQYNGTIDSWQKIPLNFAVNDYFNEANLINDKTATMLGDTPAGYSPIGTTTAEITLERDIILNGSASIDLSVKSYVFGVNLIGALTVTDRWGKVRNVNDRGYWGSPYSHRFKAEDFGKDKRIRITLPPDLKFIAKGDKLTLTLSFYSPYAFDYLKQYRITQYQQSLGVEFGILYILKEEAPVLNLPLENIIENKEENEKEEIEVETSLP